MLQVGLRQKKKGRDKDLLDSKEEQKTFAIDEAIV